MSRATLVSLLLGLLAVARAVELEVSLGAEGDSNSTFDREFFLQVGTGLEVGIITALFLLIVITGFVLLLGIQSPERFYKAKAQ